MSERETEGRRTSDPESSREHDDGEQHGPTVRDRRRIDPQTYQVREPQPAAPGASGADQPNETLSQTDPASTESDTQVSELNQALAERTADLQRLQAEYVNYKRRVDRDRDLSRKVAIEGFVKDLLPVLDDLRSAREHGELTGGFKAVGEEVERITTKYGLETFGEKGDPFDPYIHEALLHAHAEGIDGPTCVEILQPGYKIGDRILRPARVAVAEPDPDAGAPETPSEADTAETSANEQAHDQQDQ